MANEDSSPTLLPRTGEQEASPVMPETTYFNRWRASVEICRLLIESGHPKLALLAVTITVFPFAIAFGLLISWAHS